MNRIALYAGTALVLVVIGCEDPIVPLPHGETNEILVRAPGDEAIRNAVIRQSTLFPYQFVPNSERLNPLGKADMTVLIEHFTAHPGKLNIRRGAEDQALYEKRVIRVLELFAEAGIDIAKTSVADEPAGGEGLWSHRVVEILNPQQAGSAGGLIPVIGAGGKGNTYNTGAK